MHAMLLVNAADTKLLPVL